MTQLKQNLQDDALMASSLSAIECFEFDYPPLFYPVQQKQSAAWEAVERLKQADTDKKDQGALDSAAKVQKLSMDSTFDNI